MQKSFRTTLEPEHSSLRIDHQTGVCLLGSCFAEHIGRKLAESKFELLENPFGILYNPFSIADSLEKIVANTAFAKKDLAYRNDLWVSFAHHGRFSGPDSDAVLAHMNESLMRAHHFMKKAKVLFISLGTAKVYRHLELGRVVANCHKFPASNFDHFLTEKDDVVAVLAQAIQKLSIFNPSLKIIFTVSPVRHIKDGLVENQLSKAILLQAVHSLRKTFTQVDYFPSYEIMLDDLRDYRFYKSDMIHPSDLAVNYIFDFFKKRYFDESVLQLMSQVQKINTAVNHRPFYAQSASHQKFVQRVLQQMEALEKKYPFLSFSEERSRITTS